MEVSGSLRNGRGINGCFSNTSKKFSPVFGFGFGPIQKSENTLSSDLTQKFNQIKSHLIHFSSSSFDHTELDINF